MDKVQHPLQSWEWGEFRKLTGVRVVREGGIQVTIHKIPHTSWNIGYCPKTGVINGEMVQTLQQIAKENACIMIKCEPKIEVTQSHSDTVTLQKLGFVAGRPLFTKYNFVLDVSPSETELLANFKPKTRYNIRVAEKHGVRVEIDNSSEAFAKYLELTEETTKRQGFYAHGRDYHQKMWKVLCKAEIAHLLVAKYQGQIITTWVLFKYGDTLYYPYGASTREHREVMANNLVMWEAIKLAKKWKLKYLDMWGALGPDPDPNDPWYGFHTFKSGYGARHVEYIGTWDYVAKPVLYKIYRIVERLRWWWLRYKKGRD
ncbi:MAG: peptidoglycan bridge formation glycyltransferase FemA/FemB family protein [bacterium]